MQNFDFYLERRLREKKPELASRHAGCMFLFEQMLERFLVVFPNFTDHTLLHTLSVTNISNQLLGEEADKLNAEEIYIYLMATALHDIGMGVTDKDLKSFMDALGIGAGADGTGSLTKSALIREYHNDLSAAFVKKYWGIFDIPDERYTEAIARVAQGHRREELMNEIRFPCAYELAAGKTVNLAMLSALLRIADELDVASDRNPSLLYHTETMEDMTKKDRFEFSRHKAIHSVEIAQKEIVITAETDEPEMMHGVADAARTIKETLQYCRRVIGARSDIRIAGEKIRLILNRKEVLL